MSQGDSGGSEVLAEDQGEPEGQTNNEGQGGADQGGIDGSRGEILDRRITSREREADTWQGRLDTCEADNPAQIILPDWSGSGRMGHRVRKGKPSKMTVPREARPG